MSRDLTAERNARVLPVARILLAKLAAHEDLPLGVQTGDQDVATAKYFQKVYVEEFVPVVLAAQLRLNDIAYLFQVLLQPFDLLKGVVSASLDQARDLADAKNYGLKGIDELTLNTLDDVLKTYAAKEAQQEPVDNAAAGKAK